MDYLKIHFVSMSGQLPMVMLKSQLCPLYFVADRTIVISVRFEYASAVELYDNVYSMVLYASLRLIQ